MERLLNLLKRQQQTKKKQLALKKRQHLQESLYVMSGLVLT